MSECLKKSRISPKTIPELRNSRGCCAALAEINANFCCNGCAFLKKKRTSLGVRLNCIVRFLRLRRLPQAYLVTQLHSGFNRLPLQGAQQQLRCL